MLRRMPQERWFSFAARSYVHEARAARRDVLQLMATPFVLAHLGIGLLVVTVHDRRRHG